MTVDDAAIGNPHGPNPSGEPDAHRPPMPRAEVNDIAFQETFAEHVAESRLLAVAKAMLDPHIRIAQTEVNKSIAPVPADTRADPARPLQTGQLAERLARRGWHSDWPHDLTAYILQLMIIIQIRVPTINPPKCAAYGLQYISSPLFV